MKNLFVLAARRGDSFSIGTLLLNLFRVSPNTCSELVVFSKNVRPLSRKIISEILPLRVLKYRPPLGRKATAQSRYIDFFTPLSLARFEVVLPVGPYDSVIRLGEDVVVERPWKSLSRLQSRARSS